MTNKEEIEILSTQIKWEPIASDGGMTEQMYLSSDKELTALKQYLGAELPDDYVWFMKNIGRRVFNDDRIHMKLNGVSLSCLDWFRDAVDVLTFTKMASEKDDDGDLQIPANLLIISDSISRDNFLLDVSSEHYGKVWFRHHDAKWRMMNAERADGLVLVANSFSDLLSKIIKNTSPSDIDFNFSSDDKIV
ncbi:hypothetical protein BCT30_05250 [Enterovibrio norvegicus]|uniref:SMI1/KNR4 family protein n=1 Tax=Enterovibrio norvegicus TaxID=188144 RepID=A0ABV4L3Q4_9GAMM|nr:SMI1/KNR4 family protein [Enterovibrio norvegicus]MCC4800240.1 SMI1/KNR4 family protein [Enterovibrio norvegicus]OEE62330.1 hypothetical protein A1OS_18170 [Enterovibrio norvegicus]OEF55177.1 hypothetical protein A1OU_22620 [Enterovibrio norvegicus]PMH72316.1 hypothetical protein BCU62_23055 [Enterovibrio norvegicus]PMI28535.1 hypothetical protein BCU47_21220 [Enterovibrio norvegicus]